MSISVPIAERDLQDTVIEMAHLFGWRVAHFRPAMTKHGWRTPVAADGAGFPDLIMVKDSRIVVAELKSDTGKVRPDQQLWLGAFTETPAETHLWRPVDLHSGEIERVLRRKSG